MACGYSFFVSFSIYFEKHGVQAVPFNFARSSDITYVKVVLSLKHASNPSDFLYGPSHCQIVKAMKGDIQGLFWANEKKQHIQIHSAKDHQNGK